MRAWPRTRRAAGRRNPTRIVVLGFLGAIALGTVLLTLPVATTEDAGAPLLTAAFTATSAVCVTGLVVVDTPSYWSGFGQAVILVSIKLGGFGLMTAGSLVGLLLARRIGLRRRVVAQAETGALALGEVRQVVIRVAAFSACFEVLGSMLIGARLWWAYDTPIGTAAYHGVFHAVSAFNNAGFALYSDSLTRFVGDWWMSLTVAAGVVLGGLGFPVLAELRRAARSPRSWSLHTKLTLVTTAALLGVGTLGILGLEWANPATLGALDVPGRGLAGFVHAVMPRTAGFNTLDVGAMSEASWLLTAMLMFVGGGSASTAGGIKVTTFALLAFVIWSEVRGDPEVTLFGRRTPASVQRQALAVALLGLGAAVVGTLVLVVESGAGLARSLFEAFSAFGTVGLSTGITPDLPGTGQLTLMVLMFVGRAGPITLFAALVLRQRQRLYRLPEERPIIG